MSIKVRKKGSDQWIFVAGLGGSGPAGSGGGSGVVYEAGEGIIFAKTETGTKISVAVPVILLTKAEYDALSEAEKQKAALYVITDEEEEGGGGESPGVSSFNGRTGTVTPQEGDYTAAMVGARSSGWTPTAAEVGARPNTWTPTAADVGAVPAGAVTAIQALTAEEYDALANKSATTLYLIKE